MNFTKKILGSAAAFSMAALCLCNAGLPLMADDGLALGDVNYDGYVNASDAAKVLIAAASIGAGEGSGQRKKIQRPAERHDSAERHKSRRVTARSTAENGRQINKRRNQ